MRWKSVFKINYDYFWIRNTLKAIVACLIGRSLDLSVCDANDTTDGWFSAFILCDQDPRARWRNWVTVPSTVTRFAAAEWHKIEQEIGPRPIRTIRSTTIAVGPSWTPCRLGHVLATSYLILPWTSLRGKHVISFLFFLSFFAFIFMFYIILFFLFLIFKIYKKRQLKLYNCLHLFLINLFIIWLFLIIYLLKYYIFLIKSIMIVKKLYNKI